MGKPISYILLVICGILLLLVSFDLIKLFTRKRRHKRDEETQEVSE